MQCNCDLSRVTEQARTCVPDWNVVKQENYKLSHTLTCSLLCLNVIAMCKGKSWTARVEHTFIVFSREFMWLKLVAKNKCRDDV